MTTVPITRSTMFAPMLAADPSFLPEWESFLEEWANDADPPQYIALGNFARHLLDRLERGDVGGLDKVFSVVEQWHIEGDAYVREAATIGLLEALLNNLAHKEVARTTGVISMPEIEQWLLPVSKVGWDRLRLFWDGDAYALRDQP